MKRFFCVTVFATAIFLTTSLVWTPAQVPSLASGEREKGPQRKDQLTTVRTQVIEVPARTRLDLQTLRTAKATGEVDAVRTLERKLGWSSRAEQEKSPLPAGIQVVVRPELQASVDKFQDDILVSNPAWSSGMPAMASRSDGTLYVVDEDLNSNYLDLYTSTDGGSSWFYWMSIFDIVDPVNPSLAIGEGNVNRLLLAYERGSNTVDSAIHVFWFDLDTTASAIVAVETNPYFGMKHPRICVDNPEFTTWYAYITYVKGILGFRNDFYDLRFSRTLDYGASWETPTTLAGPVTWESKPDIDFGGNNLYVVYTFTSYDTGSRDVHARRSSSFGVVWDAALLLANSTDNEYEPRVTATNGGGAVVVAYTREYTPVNTDIESYYSTNAGDTWYWATLPWTSDHEMTVDLDVSPAFGKIHAAFWRSYDIQYTQADHTQPYIWSVPEQVNELNAAVYGVPPTIAVNPTRPLSLEECVAWMDHRTDIDYRIYFDTAEWDTTVIDPGGGGEFATVQDAVDDAQDGAVIILTDGTFSGPGNVDIDFLGKAIEVRSASGNPQLTTLDCQGSPQYPHRGFWFHSGEGPGAVVSGISIVNGYAAGTPLLATGGGGGILVENGSSPTLENLILEGNAASAGGGGLHCDPNSAPIVLFTIIIENSSEAGGGGVHCGIASSPTLINCTIAANSGPLAGGIYLETEATVDVTNSIIAFSPLGAAVFCEEGSSATLACCDVFGNAGGDWVGCIAGQFGEMGNFAADPLFCLFVTGEYTLQQNSPCLPENNSCGVLIGALDAGCVIDAVGDETAPARVVLQQNHPNPFNPATTIRFELPSNQPVQLSVYSVDGRHVATLLQERMPAGVHAVTWSGRDDRGRSVASGTYFYRLQTRDWQQTRRMTLVR